jgi:hypothetical protein
VSANIDTSEENNESHAGIIRNLFAKTHRPCVPEQGLLLAPSLRDWLPDDQQ